MKQPSYKRNFCQSLRKLLLNLSLCLLWLIWVPLPAGAGVLQDRLSSYPNWQKVVALQPARGDLIYPDWFRGEWQVTSSLENLSAPLAPEIVTPGFEGNRQLLHQPITFPVRFIDQGTAGVVADRTFNSLNLARAYLGNQVIGVRLDPQSVNRQITILRSACLEAKGCERQLVSLIRQRATEAPDPNQFITSEVFEQQFRGGTQLYFNQVENTTAYLRFSDRPNQIEAEQFIAIYLSPQDADYFKAANRPAAIYHYHLHFDQV